VSIPSVQAAGEPVAHAGGRGAPRGRRPPDRRRPRRRLRRLRPRRGGRPRHRDGCGATDPANPSSRDGQPVAAGDKVHLSWAGANRDPEEFEAPDEFRITGRATGTSPSAPAHIAAPVRTWRGSTCASPTAPSSSGCPTSASAWPPRTSSTTPRSTGVPWRCRCGSPPAA